MSLTKLKQHKNSWEQSGLNEMFSTLPSRNRRQRTFTTLAFLYYTLNLVLHFKMSKINETNSLRDKLASFFSFVDKYTEVIL